MAKRMICGNCLTVDQPKQKIVDSSGTWFVVLFVIGLFVWPFLILAGLCFLLGVVRAVGRLGGAGVTYACRTCKNASMVPLDTPGGQQLVAKAQGAMDGRPAPVAAPLGGIGHTGHFAQCPSCRATMAADLMFCPGCRTRVAA